MRMQIFTLLAGIILLGASIGRAQSAGPIVADSVLTIGPGMRQLPPGAFKERTDFHTLRIEPGSQLREIPAEAFSWCRSLRRVILPKGLTAIGARAFAYCESLEEINFPAGLIKIGDNAFAFCTALREVELPPTVTKMGSYVFGDCTSMRSITLPANGAELGELILSGCRGLESVTAPSRQVPGFDCNSTLFETLEPQMYTRCRLRVPRGCEKEYLKSRAFGKFAAVVPMD